MLKRAGFSLLCTIVSISLLGGCADDGGASGVEPGDASQEDAAEQGTADTVAPEDTADLFSPEDTSDIEPVENCPNACTPGQWCEGNTLVVCAAPDQGCPTEQIIPCEVGASCTKRMGVASCADDEPACREPSCILGAQECEGQLLVQCTLDAECLVWETVADCGESGGRCAKDGANAECISRQSCVDAAECSGKTSHCDGDMWTICSVDDNGCLELVQQVDCAALGGECVGPPSGCGGEVVSGWQFHLVADFATEMPSGFGPLTQLDNHPALAGDTVVFRGASWPAIVPPQATSADAVYRWSADGGLGLVAKVGEPIPHGQGNFIDFDALVINSPVASDERVVFMGNGANLQRGVYLWSTNGLTRIADRNTLIPTGTKMFDSIGGPMLNGPDLVFGGGWFGDVMGVFWWNNGTLRKVISLDEQCPNGTGSYTGLELSDLIGGELVVQGDCAAPADAIFAGGQRSLYRMSLSDAVVGPVNPNVVIDRSALIPEIGENFFILTRGQIEGGDIIFHGRGNPGPLGPFGTQIYKGVFRVSNGVVTKVVDTNDTMPGSPEKFSYDFANGLAQYLSVAGGSVLVRGVGTTGDQQTQVGVYVEPPGMGPLEKVIDLNDTLQGKPLRDILFGRHSFDGSRIALMVEFEDKSQAIYLATRLEDR